jgi:hypothetical protein
MEGNTRQISEQCGTPRQSRVSPALRRCAGQLQRRVAAERQATALHRGSARNLGSLQAPFLDFVHHPTISTVLDKTPVLGNTGTSISVGGTMNDSLEDASCTKGAEIVLQQINKADGEHMVALLSRCVFAFDLSLF